MPVTTTVQQLRLYNTRTRSTDAFKPINDPTVLMYVCGPTVYDEAHLGHARCYITWDVLFRFLKHLGYDVKYVRNITDVDDKILNRAAENGEAPSALAGRFTRRFHEVMAQLNVAEPTLETKATEYIGPMLEMVAILVEKGSAYVAADQTVYFHTPSFNAYGQLKGQNLDDLEAGARVEVDPNKKSPLDFALWKPVDLSGGTLVKGEQYWDPADYGCRQFVPGRPGWHIECSAMSRTELGDQIDLHCGGLDLIFPHHDNEIAQSEACTGVHPFSQVWMHNGFVNVSGEKMSKSLGNFSTIAELLTVYDANTIRYFILTNKYRSPVDFNEAALDSAQNWVKKRHALTHTMYETDNYEQAFGAMAAFAQRATAFWRDKNFSALFDQADQTLEVLYDELKGRFDEKMSNDLNTPEALADLNELFNGFTKENDPQYKKLCFSAFLYFSSVLGFDFVTPPVGAGGNIEAHQAALEALLGEVSPGDHAAGQGGSAESLLQAIIAVRAEARASKNWAVSDQIRDGLGAIGIQLKDQKDGPTTWDWA